MAKKELKSYAETGRKYSRLTALKVLVPAKTGTLSRWLYRCDCGEEVDRVAIHVYNGNTKSCGCFIAETAARNHIAEHRLNTTSTIHPQVDRLQLIWAEIVAELNKPTTTFMAKAKDAGAVVCEEFLSYKSFRDWFIEEFGELPSESEFQLKDPFGDFEPGNIQLVRLPNIAAHNRPGEASDKRRLLEREKVAFALAAEMKRRGKSSFHRLDFDLIRQVANSQGLPETGYRGYGYVLICAETSRLFKSPVNDDPTASDVLEYRLNEGKFVDQSLLPLRRRHYPTDRKRAKGYKCKREKFKKYLQIPGFILPEQMKKPMDSYAAARVARMKVGEYREKVTAGELICGVRVRWTVNNSGSIRTEFEDFASIAKNRKLGIK